MGQSWYRLNSRENQYGAACLWRWWWRKRRNTKSEISEKFVDRKFIRPYGGDNFLELLRRISWIVDQVFSTNFYRDVEWIHVWWQFRVFQYFWLFLSYHSTSDTVLSSRTLEQAILCGACSEQTSGITLCTHIRNELRWQTRGIGLFNRLWSKQGNPPLNVARIHGCDEFACTTRKTYGWQWRGRTIDDWQLSDDGMIDDWQLRDTEAYTVDASVAEFGIRHMYLEIWTTQSDRRCSCSTDWERTEANQLVPQERTQQHINEPNFITWNGILNLYCEEIKLLQAWGMSLWETSISCTVKVTCLT